MHMQIQYGLSLQSRKYKALRGLLVTAMAISAMVFLSCSRTPFSLVSETHAVSSVTRYGKGGEVLETYENLSIYIETEEAESEDLQMQVTSPSGLDSWNFPATRKEVDGDVYYGSSALARTDGKQLENGLYHLLVMRKDGKSLEKEFLVQTKNPETGSIPYQVSFTKQTGMLAVKNPGAEAFQPCLVSLLSKTNAVLFEGEMQGDSVDVKKLTERWTQIDSVMIGYFDSFENRTIIGWYSL